MRTHRRARREPAFLRPSRERDSKSSRVEHPNGQSCAMSFLEQRGKRSRREAGPYLISAMSAPPMPPAEIPAPPQLPAFSVPFLTAAPLWGEIPVPLDVQTTIG